MNEQESVKHQNEYPPEDVRSSKNGWKLFDFGVPYDRIGYCRAWNDNEQKMHEWAWQTDVVFPQVKVKDIQLDDTVEIPGHQPIMPLCVVEIRITKSLNGVQYKLGVQNSRDIHNVHDTEILWFEFDSHDALIVRKASKKP